MSDENGSDDGRQYFLIIIINQINIIGKLICLLMLKVDV